MVGLLHLCMANATRPPLLNINTILQLGFGGEYVSRKSLALSTLSSNPISRSEPAQNIRPAPVRTITLTRWSRWNMAYACSRLWPICGVKALFLSGRLSLRITIGVAVGDGG